MGKIAYLVAVCLLAIGLAGCDPRVRADAPTAEPADRIDLFSKDASPTGFDVFGLSAEQLAAIDSQDASKRSAHFRVFVDNGKADSPSILGSVSVEEKVLRFTPRFPLEPGLRYRAVFDPRKLADSDADEGNGEISATFEIPRRAAGEPTVVTQTYPTAERLPENQLKFYLHFSAPMSRGQAYQHIHLLDESGKENEGAFLELDQELWDPDQRRFTLLCDPGRVKRGLKPREELGPVLEQGKTYTLVVDQAWRDANDLPLEAEFRKSFHVLPPDETPIDTGDWKVEPPRDGSSEPLIVRFPEPLDHSLLERVLWIVNAEGMKLGGSIEIADRETTWSFRPDRPWTAGEYQLVVATTLEDLAGNSIGRAFEVDASKPAQPAKQAPTASVPFQIR